MRGACPSKTHRYNARMFFGWLLSLLVSGVSLPVLGKKSKSDNLD